MKKAVLAYLGTAVLSVSGYKGPGMNRALNLEQRVFLNRLERMLNSTNFSPAARIGREQVQEMLNLGRERRWSESLVPLLKVFQLYVERV